MAAGLTSPAAIGPRGKLYALLRTPATTTSASASSGSPSQPRRAPRPTRL